MARWRLMQPHYLNVPGTEWEYKEVDRTSGKQGRKVYPVPLLLDPNNPGDQNYPGEVVVAHEGGAQRQDIIFVGPPTPDMEPLDAEAEELSNSLRPSWQHPIESLPGQGFSQSLIADFQRQIAEATTKNTPIPGVSKSEFEELKAQLALLVEQNSALQEKLADKPGRRA